MDIKSSPKTTGGRGNHLSPPAICKGIIPAAGLGTRLLPISRIVPKEMFPIEQKPVIHYIAEEAFTAGLTEIGIILRPGKEMIREYFTALTEEEWPGRMRIEYIYQKEPQGLGDAILCAEDFIAGWPFAVLLPDDLYPDSNPTRELAMAFVAYGQSILGLGEVAPEEAPFYGKVAVEKKRFGENLERIAYMFPKENKPNMTRPEAGHWNSFGRYVLTPTVFELKYDRHPGVELDDGDLIRGLIRGEPVYGLHLSCARFDTGRFSSYVQAVAGFQRMKSGYEKRPAGAQGVYANTYHETLFHRG